MPLGMISLTSFAYTVPFALMDVAALVYACVTWRRHPMASGLLSASMALGLARQLFSLVALPGAGANSSISLTGLLIPAMTLVALLSHALLLAAVVVATREGTAGLERG